MLRHTPFIALSLLAALSIQTTSVFAEDLVPLRSTEPTQGYQPVYNQTQQNYGSYGGSPTIQGRVATAPAGSSLYAALDTPISSQYARTGDRVSLRLSSPLSSNGSVILPAGSVLEGQVASAIPAGRGGRHGSVDVRFTNALTPDGQRVPLTASIKTEDGSGVLRGGTTKGRVAKATVSAGAGAGAGALLGTALGALSDGSVGRGAVFGTAIGGGVGAAKALWDRGSEVNLTAGSDVEVVLERPLTTGGSTGGYSQPNTGYNPY